MLPVSHFQGAEATCQYDQHRSPRCNQEGKVISFPPVNVCVQYHSLPGDRAAGGKDSFLGGRVSPL